MKNSDCLLLAAELLALLPCPGSQLLAQASSIPVRLQLEASKREVEAGGKVAVTVSLRNYRNQSVPALQDLEVAIDSDAGQATTVVIPAGKASSQLEMVPSRPGLERITARSPKLSPGTLLLVVTASKAAETAGTMPSREGAGLHVTSPAATHRTTGSAAAAAAAPSRAAKAERSVAPGIASESPTGGPSPPPPPPPAANAGSQPSRLDVQIEPPEIFPEGNIWTTDVTVVALTANQQLAIAGADIPIQLTSNVGTLSTTHAVIPLGSASTAAETIRLTCQHSGNDVVSAVSPLGRAERQIIYNLQTPTQLRVEAKPVEVVNDGRTWVNVSVFLLGADERPTSYSDRDLDVSLSPSLGTLEPSHVKIPRGTYWADAKLTSTRHGDAVVAASAPELTEARSAVIHFLFPWLVVVVSVAGGVLGGVVRTAKGSFSGKWQAHWARNLAVGAIFGLVFYVLAYFGATTAIPKAEMSINVALIPTTNELGSLVLGFVGGFVGRHFWKV
ncbi:MAG TPA: hypothetical protein VG204_20670 [Terriglobia bacterium]|nr:hypothetical protein [Terriglobia bacterium]